MTIPTPRIRTFPLWHDYHYPGHGYDDVALIAHARTVEGLRGPAEITVRMMGGEYITTVRLFV